MIRDLQKSLDVRRIASILIYILVCVGVGFAAFALIHQHASNHRVPSAFGYEYLVVFLPFLAVLISFPFWPLIIYSISKILFRNAQLRLISPAILAVSVLSFGVSLLVTGLFFTWARQQ
jgi:hypothetical protein